MRFLTSLLFISIAAAAVVTLTKDNFDEVVNGEKHVFVKFYAPWCGHCKALAPEYITFADSFAKEDSVIIAEVNADEETALAERFDITGYPTLKFFPAGAADKPIAYDGQRTAEDLTRWTNEHAGTNVKVKAPVNNVVVLTPSNFDEVVKNSGKVVFVKFYAPWCGHCKHLAPTYIELANVFAEEPSVVIAELDADAHRDLAGQYDVHGYPTLKLFKGEKIVSYSGDRSLEHMVNFVNENAGTARLPDGSVDSSYGRIAAVDEVIAAMKEVTKENVALVKEALEKVPEELESSKKVYLSVLKKLEARGKEYVETEQKRIQKFLSSDSVSKLKKSAFRIRMNILKAFEALKGETKEEEEL